MTAAPTDLLSKDEFFDDFRDDPAARAIWERTALARAVGGALVRYRADRRLTQRALAAHLGMKPSAVARLEAAEHNPSIETLQRLASALGMAFTIEVTPAEPAGGERIREEITTADGSRVLVAAG